MKWTSDLNPVALSIFGLDIRWYGLVYILGFFVSLHWGWYLWKKTKPSYKVTKEQFENLIFGGFFAGIVGGRIGHFLFYSPSTFINDIAEVFKPWHGGMSIHGGILGTILFLFFWCRKNKVPFLRIADLLVIPLAITLFFGRGANFMNGELVGRVTDQTWGVIFPYTDELLRHPSQIYEMIKNLIIFGFLYLGFQKGLWKKMGLLSGIFLLGYGILRFFIEYFRLPDGFIYIFTTGQTLCLFMVLIGTLLTWKGLKK